MRLSERDRRALILLGVALAVALALRLWLGRETPATVVEAVDSAAAAEQRLAQVRKLAALAPVRQKQIESLQAELAEWEKGLIQAETAQQAQAQMLQILRRLGNAQDPKLDVRSEEIGAVRPLGKEKDYGEALVSVSFTCAIEQLVNLLAELGAQPEAIGVEELTISAANPKDKTLNVRLTVAGLIPYKLVPEKKGLGAL
jgi:hypothetical protein